MGIRSANYLDDSAASSHAVTQDDVEKNALRQQNEAVYEMTISNGVTALREAQPSDIKEIIRALAILKHFLANGIQKDANASVVGDEILSLLRTKGFSPDFSITSHMEIENTNQQSVSRVFIARVMKRIMSRGASDARLPEDLAAYSQNWQRKSTKKNIRSRILCLFGIK